jgi:hypothetical protein
MVTRRPCPRTLMEAHTLLTSLRPSTASSPRAWLRFYRHSAAVYAEIAEIDRGHHHEALYWATRERAKADELAATIAKTKSPTAPSESTSDGRDVSESS